MLLKVLTKVNLVYYSIQIENVEKFIKDKFSIMYMFIRPPKHPTKYDIEFNNFKKDNKSLAYNDGTKITFNMYILNKFLTLLDTEKAQETFIILLILHEIMHYHIKRNFKQSRIEFEEEVNKEAFNIFKRMNSYSYKDLYDSVMRMKYMNNINKNSNEYQIYKFIKDTLLFPIGEEEYYSDGKS